MKYEISSSKLRGAILGQPTERQNGPNLYSETGSELS